MKLLILGGSGFVSGRLAQIATAQGHEVWCVTRGNRPIPEGVHALTCDAHDPTALRAALASAQLQWDAALDCICRDAASASVDLSVLPAFTNRLLVISTDSVYHPAYKRVPQDETGVYLHDGGYGSSKRQMEEVFLDAAAHSESPFAWTIFREESQETFADSGLYRARERSHSTCFCSPARRGVPGKAIPVRRSFSSEYARWHKCPLNWGCASR